VLGVGSVLGVRIAARPLTTMTWTISVPNRFASATSGGEVKYQTRVRTPTWERIISAVTG
jgi:hypothetical protein